MARKLIRRKAKLTAIELTILLLFVTPTHIHARVGDQHDASWFIGIADLSSSMLSPDESRLAVVTCKNDSGGPGGRVLRSSELQVWDFQKAKLMFRKPLGQWEETYAFCPPAYVRYTSDGALITVYTQGGAIRVLRGDDFQELRTIRLETEPATVSAHGVPAQANPSQFHVTGFETSPVGHFLALRVCRDTRYTHAVFFTTPHYLGGFAVVYDLDSGLQLSQWTFGHRLFDYGKGVAWRGDGKVLAVAASDAAPCVRGGSSVYVLDRTTSNIAREIRTPNLAGDIAYGQSEIYVANGSCPGHFGNRAPELAVFSSTTGRKVAAIKTSGSGIRYQIALSADKRRLLGYIGREEMTFEGMEDTLKVIDSKFEAWDLASGRSIYVSPDLGYRWPGTGGNPTLALSASGDLAIVSAFGAGFCVFRLPATGN